MCVFNQNGLKVKINNATKLHRSAVTDFEILYFKIQLLNNLKNKKTMAAQAERSQLKIGEVARILNIAVETIRMYEREGILIIDKTETGQRVFNEDDLHWLGCIRRLIKEKGLNIEGIRRLLALLPCWQLKPCTLEDYKSCPVSQGSAKPCWMRKSELPEICKTADCRSCQGYQSARNCENLKILLYQSLPS
jgi:MerR family transcriptional regulator/heat shock protein HspR